MKLNDMQKVSKAGNVNFELDQIKNLQKQADGFLTMSTNTCGELYTVFCC